MEMSNAARPLLAYFSHSYRAVDKEINLSFWQLLSDQNLYFTVDSEENRGKPMYVSYLEWMMRRSSCFVAVIPRRQDSPPYNCSPYQVFENGLAIRAAKPRLVFVEAGLDETLFGDRPYEVYSFRRRKRWLEEDAERFAEAAQMLAERAHAFIPSELGLRKPIGLLADTTQGKAYGTATLEAIRQEVLDLGYSFEQENPLKFRYDFLFVQQIERYGVLICEMRRPYIAPDILGLTHGRCVPMIRICHLREGEDIKSAKAAMRLSGDQTRLEKQNFKQLPLILSQYEIDKDMEPVIFWRNPERLAAKIGIRLQKIAEQRVDLIDEQEARNYFLPIGRLEGRVFVSNARTQNNLAKELSAALERNAVKFFHYKRKGAIPLGREWLPEIKREIRHSIVFIALIDEFYEDSKWCMVELAEAMRLFEQDQVEMHVYVVGKEVELPEDLIPLQVDYIQHFDDQRKIDRIVEKTTQFLEFGKQVQLRVRDREQLVEILARLPPLSHMDMRKQLLQVCGLPSEVFQTVRIDAESPTPAAAQIVDDLSGWKEKIRPHVKALGLFLSYIMKLVEYQDQTLLARIMQDYELMPDVKLRIRARVPSQELGFAYIHEWGELGTFESIEGGTLADRQLRDGELSTKLYGLSVKASADQGDWQRILSVIGEDVVNHEIFSDLIERYRAMGARGVPSDQLGFCFATDVKGLRVPFEWAIFKGQNAPICLQHPVRRFLTGAPEPRPVLRSMLTDELAVPLRVLLVASNTGGIPQVEKEIEDISELFSALFRELGWPESNIKKLDSSQATLDRVEKEIRQGNYHIFHFAGHGGFYKGKPVLQVFEDHTAQRKDFVSATTLRRWIIDSDLRFVYLSSCRGAATEAPELDSAIQHLENLAHAVVEARVSEMISFIWPIEDGQSRTLAQRFYRRFLEGFDANLALYYARTSFEEGNRIWAAPVILQQS
jgi:hypothetical protein